VQHLDAVQQMVEVWTGRLEGLLARHWPEATGLLTLQAVSLLKLLARYGGPAGVAGDEQAANRLSQWGGRLLTPGKIAAVLETARETVGVPQDEYEREWLRECAQELLKARQARERAQRELKRLAKENATVSRLGRAVGFATASVLWVYLGNPQGYHCGEAYRKAMGLNLKERSSGKCKGQLRITKRGPGAVRRWMYLASMRLLREAEVRSWFAAKKARDGGRGGKALVGVMRKLALALHRAAVDEVEFDPAKLFPGKPLKQTSASAQARQKGPPLRAFAITSIPEG
jgi:transposase